MTVDRSHPVPSASEEFWAHSKGPVVKRLFEKWDFGHLTTKRFLEELEMIGISVTEEVAMLLSHNEKARGVHFTEFAKLIIRANKPRHEAPPPPSPSPSQVSNVSCSTHRRTGLRREILRLGDESASAKAPFDNDYVTDDNSPSSRSICSAAASSVGSRYSHRSYGYDVLRRGRGVASALGADDDDIAEIDDLEATLRSNASSMRHAGESSQVDLTGEARRHTETQHSRAASDHGMGILRGCATAKEEDHVLSPKRGDNNSHKTKRHFTDRGATFNPFVWEERSMENSRVDNSKRSLYPFATEQDDLNTLRCSINRAPLNRVGRTAVGGTGVHPDARLATLLD